MKFSLKKIPRTQTKTAKTKKTNMSRKKIIITLCILLFILITIVFIVKPNLNAPKLPADELIATAIEQLQQHPSLKFSTESKVLLANNTIPYGNIEGEIADNKHFHAKGTILGSELEIYQIDDKTYRKDTLTEEWLVTEDGAIINESALINELNPTLNFLNLEIMEPKILEDEFADEEHCYKVTFFLVEASHPLQSYFQNLTYTLWITQDDHQIRRAMISGDTQSNDIKETLQMEIEFWDWGKPITIEPPIIEESA